jgi:hypothetical protein
VKNRTAYQITLGEHVRTTTKREDFELLRLKRTDIQEGAIFAVILGVVVFGILAVPEELIIHIFGG